MHRASVDRATPDRSEGAVVVFHQRHRVVFERRAAPDEALSRAQEPLDPRMRRDHFRDVERMRAEVAEHVARPGEPRIDAPSRRGVALLDRRAVEAVRELQVDQTDIAELAGGAPSPAPVRSSDGRRSRRLRRRSCAVSSARRRRSSASATREAQRLLADDVHTVFERRLGDLEMGVVRRRDRHGLNTVGPRRLGCEQRAVIRIAAVGARRRVRHRKRVPRSRIDVERAGDEVKGPVAQGGRAVDVADLARRAPPPTIAQRIGFSVCLLPTIIAMRSFPTLLRTRRCADSRGSPSRRRGCRRRCADRAPARR